MIGHQTPLLFASLKTATTSPNSEASHLPHRRLSLSQNTAVMRPAPSTASAALRSWTRHNLPTSQTTTTAARLVATPVAPQTTSITQRRHASDAAASSSFDSPFQKVDTNKIPNFTKYRAKSPEVSNRVFQYFMVGSMGLLTAAGAKATVQGTLYTYYESL